MKTKARQYALPDKYHDVVEDIEALRETISKIDSDLNDIATSTDHIQDAIEEASTRVLKVGELHNGELKDIAPERFISFGEEECVCVDGLLNNSKGHGGQCTINVGPSERGWIDINNASVIEGNGNEICIFNDGEKDEEQEKELVNIQTTMDFVCENNESIILRNEQEEIVEPLLLASKTSNGLIKIGEGFNIEDGVLSKSPIPMATHETAGLVILGDGFENKNDTICYNNSASLNNFGVVKLSKDFYLDDSGILLIKREKNPNIIYDYGRDGTVLGGNVDVFEDTVHYFTVVHENISIKININFELKTDFTFILEVASDGGRKLVFEDDFESGLKEYILENGRTYFEITKKMGVPKYSAVIYAKGTRFDKEGFLRKIPYLRSDNDKGYTVTASSTHSELYRPYHAFDDDLFQRWSSRSEPTYPQWVQLQLPTAQLFTKIRLTSRFDGYLSRMPFNFQVQGSNDASTWINLLEINEAKWPLPCESRIFSLNNTKKYLYYRFVANANGGDQYLELPELEYGIGGIADENVVHEYTHIVPLMFAGSQNGYAVSASSNSTDAYKVFNRLSTSDYWSSTTKTNSSCECSDTWLQIQLPNAVVCNCFVMGLYKNAKDYRTQFPSAFSFKGSQDGTSWTTLLNVFRAGEYGALLRTWVFENSVAYKYYRLNITKTSVANKEVIFGMLALLHKTTQGTSGDDTKGSVGTAPASSGGGITL